MFKSKIFNGVMRYMLVAMLALLPNTIWGITEKNMVTLCDGNSITFSNIGEYLKTDDYSAWYVLDAAGNQVDISSWTYNTSIVWSEVKVEGKFLVTKKPWGIESYRTWTWTSNLTSLAGYKIVVLTSTKEELYNNPSESLAEGKTTFELVSKDEIPQFGKLTGASIDINKEIADASLAGGSITTEDLCSAISSLNIWSGGTTGTLSLKDSPFYLRLSIVDKNGKSVNLNEFTIKRNGTDITSQKLDSYMYGNFACYKNSRGLYCYNKQDDNKKLSANDLNFTITCPAGKNINDYDVVFCVSNETPNISADLVMSEPNLVGQVKYSILSSSQIKNLKLTESASTGVAVRDTKSIVLGTNLNIDLTTADNLQFIKQQLGLEDVDNFGELYVRWKITKKDGTSKVDGISCKSPMKSQEDIYWTWYSDDASSSFANALNANFVVPEGLDINDVDISCVISDETPTTQYGFVTTEPTLKAKFNVQLLDKYSMPFNHYVGHANTAFDENDMQQTAEWEYYVYVKDANEQVELVLPFDDYKGSSDALEPQGYFRWYDFNKDRASANLRANTGTLLHNIKSGSEDYGLFAYNLYPAFPTSSNIGVTYTAPTGASSDDWAGEDIACDISRYIDGLDATKTYLVHEPTLSIRYIFHIRSAKKLADNIMNTAIGKNTQREGYRTYEDGKYLTVGMKDENSTLTLRLDLSDAKKYYFHPLADGIYENDGAFSGFTKRVYYVDEKDKLVESNFDKTKLCHATKIEWWAYDKTKTYCLCLGTKTDRFFDLKMNNLNTSWMSVYKSGANKTFTFTYGDPVYIVAYAMDDENHRCPIANFDVRFMNNHPMTKEEIVKEGLNNRLISYLDEHYKMATKPITFDDDDVEQTVAAPTNPNDNQDRLPSKWDRRAYSFVYRDLIDYDATNYNGLDKIGHSPLHGDYCLYKSANLSGVSTNSEKYLWWDTNTLYDKTYEITNGSQYGHFLYVDASDESRKIAASDFTADLCTGQQLIFIASVADMTGADTKPQIMFKLFGVNKDINGNIVDKHLIHSFSSGDFKDNLDSKQPATWYQVYGKITLQKESNVEQYSDFRLEIDNYCKGTQGADYAIDDIRMYLAPAKVQVIQEKPACGGATTGAIKLKIRAIHETLNAILGHNDTKIYFRFVGEDGNPVNTDYSYTLKDITTGNTSTVPGTEYGTVDVYDSEETCKNFEIDGTNMIEQDSEGETYIVISNKDFPLTTGKKYYVSVSTEDPTKGNANWGSPSEVCSVYSNWFEMVSQHPIITDAKGNIVTDYKIPCDKAGSYDVTIKGQLTTTDPHNGGKITLDGVEFFWYIDDPAVATNKLNETASNEITISKDRLPLGETHKIFMLPKGTENSDGYIPYEINGTIYLLCSAATPVPLRVMKDGPQLNFGFNDVDYPFKASDYEASLRIGLPQLEKLKTSNGNLQIPIHDISYLSGVTDKILTFIDDSKTGTSEPTTNVYVATTNDPLWNAAGATLLSTSVATLSSSTLSEIVAGVQSTLNLKFSDDVLKNFHEGYYYELRFAFEQGTASAGTANCPGEAYLKLKIVPEFITWTPTAGGGMNANWNNDDNWHRSSSTELYDNEYPDYQAYGNAHGITPKVAIPTQNSYVPMKFTKVTIDNLKGLPFPDLGNIVYRTTNQIATKLTNGKGNEATKYIQYDIMAFWNEADTDKGLDTDGNLKCEKFYGNTCHQIYFKPQGELRDQCYLVYDKAWVEKELVPNKWYTMASPLQYIYAGDMYVPASNGRQETKAFTDIKFTDKTADGKADVYSRSKYPVYQRAWMKSGVEEITPESYPASHYPEGAKTDDMNLNLGYWSHVYNKVDECYTGGSFGGFAIKAGNALLPKDQTKNALLRLPKEDKEYQYFDYTGSTPSSSKMPVAKNDGHGKLLVAYNNEEKHLAEMTQSLGADNNSGFYLVANPYTCSISLKKFFEVNTGLQNAVWLIDGGDVNSVSATDLTNKDFFVQPTQSFFVKKDGTASVDAVKFTSAMYVDRLLSAGVIIAPGYLTNVNVSAQNAKGQSSMARIAVRNEASDDYDEQEDVDLLCDQNLSGIPQVYTVAGSQAVAVNATPKVEWMPMGVIMENGEKKERVNLDFKGVAKLDAPLYLYDAANGQYTELQDGNEVSIQANEHGRYFLTQTRGTTGIQQIEAEAESNQLKVYSPAAGMIVVSALNGEKLGRVEVFTLDGKRVHSYQLPDKQRMILRVPSGVYIVKASTQSCAQAKGQKVAVR
ncbi:T9SS type A sorting domain-containing protein [Segatella copri]|uniref:T9SS type A sorting domain-containing protein n=2 Tax=Segatella copri TaxID=165179 RepID=UPI001ED0F85F|nr:T9SS type A sorting domain-containing protein [Segatella copri]